MLMSESSQRPRSPRVPVEFALDVEGTDASGKSFQAKAKAIKISRGGATLLIDVDVPLGSTVQLRSFRSTTPGNLRLATR